MRIFDQPRLLKEVLINVNSIALPPLVQVPQTSNSHDFLNCPGNDHKVILQDKIASQINHLSFAILEESFPSCKLS